MRTKDILYLMSFMLTFLSVGMLYAYVYDVEPLTAEKHYAMERDVFNRTCDNSLRDFPSYQEWLDQEAQREARFHDYINNLSEKVGRDYAEIWEPGISQRHMSAEEFARERGPD